MHKLALPILSTLFYGAAALANQADELPAPQGAVSVIKPERGFIDDAFALSADGSIFYYINTDGASWASLRAIGLQPRAGTGSPPAAASPTPAPGAEPSSLPPLRLSGAGHKPAQPPPKATAPTKAPVSAFTLAPGASVELLDKLPLSIVRMALLPEDRVLLITRDLETGNTVDGAVYSLRTHTAVPIAGTSEGTLGPASDIVLSSSASGPVIVAIDRPAAERGEYKLQVYNAATLKLTGQRSYHVRENDGRIPTAQGSAMPLYFIDDYQTLVAKHDGFFDKKKDLRQPDFLAFIDTLSGKLRRSQPITDPAGVLELPRLHGTHSESVFVVADAETQKINLFVVNEKVPQDAVAETHGPLELPRPANIYDGPTVRYQLLSPQKLLLSLTVDPVNEQAVAAHHTDPDDIDFCLVDLSSATAAPSPPVHKLRTVPGYKRPTIWVAATAAGARTALLRKHKNFPRGGTQVEVYDLDLATGLATSP